MTAETAQSIIKKTENIKKFALILLGIGATLFLLGYFNENIAKIGVIFFIIGVFIGIFAKEEKSGTSSSNNED